MAEKEVDPKSAKGESCEKKIPVFTVLKNNAILKNIFLLNGPPLSISNQEEEESEEMILIGRHPDCSITLDHPSISRFHLRLYSKPSSLKLSVFDLSSVHGTWVSGKKIEPGVRVELNEGDTVRLGGSSRLYRLHWVPLSRAYDLDDPFVPPTDVTMPVKEREEEMNQDENCSSVEKNQIQSACNDLEDLSLLLSIEELKSSENKVSPSAPPMPEFLRASCYEEAAENVNLSREEHEQNVISGISSGPLSKESVAAETESRQSNKENENPQPGFLGVLSEKENAESPTRNLEQTRNLLEFFNSSFSDEEVENICSLKMDHKQEEISGIGCHPSATGSLDSSTPCSIAILGSKDQLYLDKQNHHLQHFLGTGVSARKTSENTPSKSEQELNLPVNLNHSLSDEGGCLVGDKSEVDDNQSSLKSDYKQKEISGLWSGAPRMDSVNFSLPGDNILTEIGVEQLDGGNNKPQTFDTNVSQTKDIDTITSEQRFGVSRIWSRRGKSTSVQILTDKQKGDNSGVITDTEVELLYKENMENESNSKALFSSVGGDEEEIFTPDKENFIPNSLLLRSMKKTNKVEEIKQSMTLRLSPLKNSFGCNIDSEEDIFATSDKENHTPKVLQEQNLVRTASKSNARLEPEVKAIKSRVDRVPFQSLLADSTSKSNSSKSRVPDPTRSSNSVNNAQTVEKNAVVGYSKRWIMVADTNCLLNKESRKALQLLQGLKGTRLIIPRIVIRELDCMKRRGYLFRKTTEVSSALQWIEDCMLNTNWWIRVQSSVEEGRHLAPTPPASPLSTLKEESRDFPFCSAPLSASVNLLEIVSPTSGDHILECALLFKKMKRDEQLVLLSDDVSLKIKAMAEGMICEAAEEFRESLVNPFSERFLWAESSPRGLTWSCADEIVLREKYYRSLKPSKSGEGLKGLKLILLHNSQYRKISSIN